MTGRVVPFGVGIAAVVVAALVVGVTATGFGTMPECGTGSYFLYPFQPIVTLLFVVAVTTLVASIVVMPRSPWLIGPLVVAEAIGAGLGCVLSEAANGCDRYRDHSYLETAVIITLVVGGIIATMVGLIWAARPRPGPDGPMPPMPPGSHALGGYRVRRSEVQGVARREHVWLALSPTLLTVLGSGGPTVTMERDAVTAEVGDGGRITVSVDRWLQLELAPDPGIDPWALSIALANDPV